MHIMLDLETLAASPDAVVLSIGAVAFSAHDGVAPVQYYAVVRLDEQSERSIDPDTVSWWMRQAQENPMAADVFEGPREPVDIALQRLTTFMNTFLTPDGGVWANGPDFDCVIMKSLFTELKMPTPWRHNQHRCFRTLRWMAKSLGITDAHLDVTPNQSMHNALADADWQARYVIAAAEEMGVDL